MARTKQTGGEKDPRLPPQRQGTQVTSASSTAASADASPTIPASQASPSIPVSVGSVPDPMNPASLPHVPSPVPPPPTFSIPPQSFDGRFGIPPLSVTGSTPPASSLTPHSTTIPSTSQAGGTRTPTPSTQVGSTGQDLLLVRRDGHGGLNPHNKVMKIIKRLIENFLSGPYSTFKKMPLADRELFYREFRKRVQKPDDMPDVELRKRFITKITKRWTDRMAEIRAAKKKPRWMSDDIYEALQREWSGERFLRASETNKKNRASQVGGSMHTGGSRSTGASREHLAGEIGRDPEPDELYRYTHIRRVDGSWIEPRHQVTYEQFQEYMARYEEQMSQQDPASDQSVTPPSRADMWAQSTGGRNRGRIFGLARAEGVGTPGASSSRAPAPSRAEMQAMQDQMAAERLASQQRDLAAQQREMALKQELMDMRSILTSSYDRIHSLEASQAETNRTVAELVRGIRVPPPVIASETADSSDSSSTASSGGADDGGAGDGGEDDGGNAEMFDDHMDFLNNADPFA